MRSSVKLALSFFLSSTMLISATALSKTAGTAALPASVQMQSSVEGVTEYRLENGLRVLLAPDEAKPSVTVNMTYLVGSRHENYGQTGMAHLLEHMLFRGTPTLRNALAEFSRRGLSANGTTSNDRTNYYASFAADPEQLAWYLRWQADTMVNALILREDLDAEMTVVRNEMEQGENSPFRILMQQMQAAAYQWHSYGRSVIGARSDVENVDIEQLRAFYRKYYQPDNAVLIVSGKFDPESVLKVIDDAFSPIPRPDRQLPREYTVEPVQDGERGVTVRRQGGTPIVASFFHGLSAADPDSAAFELGIAALGDTPSGRLYKALVEPGLASSAFGFASSQRYPGYALFGAQLEAGMDIDKARKTLNETLEKLASEPLQEADLERMRSKWLTGWQQGTSDPAALASMLSEAAAAGDWRLLFLQRDRVETVTLDDVQRVLAARLVQSNRTEGTYLPTPEPLRAPAAPTTDLQALLDGYQGKENAGAAAAFDASPENIDASTQRGVIELDHGAIRTALLTKPTRGNRVEASLLVRFGDADSLKGKSGVAAATAALLDHGTASLSRQEIQDRFTALQADVGFSGSAGSVSVQISTLRQHLPETLALVADILRNPSLDAAELERYKRRALTSLSNAKSEPSALARQALARHDNPWPADDPRYTPTFEESMKRIEALSADDLKAFHKEFYGAGNMLFSAVGDMDPEAVTQALRTGFQSWQAAPSYTRLSNPYRTVKPVHLRIDTPGKANAFYMARLPVKLQDTDADYPALILANYLLGGSATSRLWNRVRVQDGLSYDVRSSLSVSAHEPSGSLSVQAIHAPDTSERLQKVIAQELDTALKEGFSDEEIQAGVQALLNYRKLARAQDGALAGTWMHLMDLDRTFAWSAEMDKRIAALTKADVDRVLRAYLKPDDMASALASDQAKQ
ncbi:M16 family metallopeptidase [Paracandidimonas soli]|uniref:M16 family metallopeptidase n=1 Tax=Paracandidimonas soli TaxID=1917182 RepID=UPI000A452772